MRKLIIILFLLFISSSIWAQKELDEKQRQQIIEKIIENKEGGADYTDLQDQLDLFLQNPLDINLCSIEQLRLLSILNELQIEAIINHRKKYGKFIEIQELQVIDIIPQSTLYTLIPFISIDRANVNIPSFKKMLKYSRHDIINLYQQQVQENEGQRRRIKNDTFDKPYYEGNSLRSVLRYKMSYKNYFSIGFTGEKDAGEQFGQGINKRGFDFNSAYIYIGERKYIKKLVIGDFNLMLAQGLTFGSGLSFGKSAMVTNVKRNNNGIRPYRSVNENEFLRGIGTTLAFGRTVLTVFASKKKIDGNINGDTLTGEDQSFTSIISSGLHRTKAEIVDKQTISQTLAGGRIAYKLKKLEIGASYAIIHFDQPLLKDLKPYNMYSFSGTTDKKAGIDYTWNYKNMMVFGETSKNLNGGWATINSILISLSQNLDYISVIRSYDKNFKPVLCNGWGENGQNENEQGWYNAISARFKKGFSFNAYFDIYRSPWLRYQINQPGTSGHDYLLELGYSPSKTFTGYIRLRSETKPLANTTEDYFKEITNYTRHSIRTNLQVKISRNLNMKSRLEISQWSSTSQQTQKGIICFQDFDWKSSTGKISITGRITMFDIDGFYSRIYSYEDDMIYTYSVPMFLNRGTRVFILSKIKIRRNVDLWFKIAHTQYKNISTIGSGLDQILVPYKTDIKLQLRISLGKKS